MRTALLLAAGIGAAAIAGEAVGLSCVAPSDYLNSADLVVIGEVGSVRHVSTEKVDPWPQDGIRDVTVRNMSAEVRTVKVLRGGGAPKAFTYKFRDKSIDCDFSVQAKPRSRVVFALRKDRRTGQWIASGHPLESWNPKAPRLM